MIGKPEWFTYRKYGWGIAPKTKEGWIYIGVFMAVIMGFAFASSYLGLPAEIITGGSIAIVLVIIADTFHIMFHLKDVHDERENQHQLIIERNVAYAGIFAIIGVILYQSVQYSLDASKGIVKSYLPFDLELGIILAVMVLAKAVSSYYVDRKL